MKAITGILSLFLLGAGCSQRSASVQQPPQAPVVSKFSVAEVAADKPSANSDVANTKSVNVSVQLNKSTLFSQEFIYQLDVQYTSQTDPKLNLYTQSEAGGAFVASFRIDGDELQLVADMKNQFPSAVNHPEQLVSRYKILAQDEQTLTVAAADSSTFIAQQFLEGNPSPAAPAGSTPTFEVLDHWVRSFDYAADGNYILQESSVELPDGTRIEAMESVFPRATLAPGSDFKKFKMSGDPASLDGVAPDSPDEVSRFRLLAGPAVYTGEDQHAWAQHYDLSARADGSPSTIDWYVTPNIPDEYLEPVKEAVEGWNRYFRSYQGFHRDVMRFMGRLPDGVHLGDPRYNVINWDSREIAGAAYESQDADPETGKQSHSMIYMPAAWIFIGTKYWTNGIASDAPNANNVSLSTPPRHGFSKRISCSESLADATMAVASGAASSSDSKGAIQTFGIELLKQTLFHEVGHALGLAHNFKAYTSWNPNDAHSMFSTSIMAYNDYEIERAAFKAIDSADGPLLEYDRQALSAIYDQGKDILASDPVEPHCADNEADNLTGGVDPICIRYANEVDPTQSVEDAYKRITDATMANTVTLSQALANVPAIVLTDDVVAQIKTSDDLAAAAKKLAKQITGSMTFYVVSGKRSLDYTMRLNVKSLYEFEDGILPDSYNEKGMRERAFAGVQNSLGLMALPQAVNDAANAAMEAGLARLQKSPAMTGMSTHDAGAEIAALRDKVSKAIVAFASDDANGLPKLRLAVLGALARKTEVPLYLGKLGDQKLDYETALVGALADIVTNSKHDSARLDSERVAAATALATYKNRVPGDTAIKAIADGLNAELVAADTNAKRETLESIVTALGI